MNNLQGGFMVIARWMEKDVLKGFLLADTTYHIHMAPLEAIQRNGYLAPYLNAQYDAQFQTLVGTNGASLTDYPAVSEDYALLNGNGIIVMATVVDAANGKPLGVVAFNGMGTRFNLTYKKLKELTRRFPACNFKMTVDQSYGEIAVKKDGSYFDTVEITRPKIEKKQQDQCVSMSSPGAIPVMGVYNMDSMKENEFNHSSQEKLVLTLLNMSKLTPYYYTCLMAITRKPAPIGTMGVTEDTMYYDPKFIAELRVDELTFVFIHEIMHLAMQHPIRFGNRTNSALWNVATDLYINSIICNDYGVNFGGGSVDYRSQGSIKTPDFGVYMETIGEKIDLATDSPETIYARLLKENGQQSNMSQNQQGGQKQQSQSGQSGGKSGAAQLVAEGIKEVMEGMKAAQQANNNSQSSQQAGDQISQGLKDVQDAVKNHNQQGSLDQAQQGVQQTQQGINQMNKLPGTSNPQAGQQQNGQQGQPQSGQQPGQQGQPQSGQQSGGQQGQQSGGSSSQGMTPQQQMQRGLNKIQQGLSAMASGGAQQQQGGGQSGGQSGIGQGQGQSSQGQGSSGQAGQSNGQGQKGQSGQSSVGEDDFSGNGTYESMQQVSVVYNGKKLTGTIMRDVMSKNDSKDKDAMQDKLDSSRSALQKIKTKIQIEEEERGESLEKNAGAGAGLTKRYIEVGLSAGVDWRVIFRNICKDKPKKTFTLAQPNQDYMTMGMTIADRRRIGKPERVSHVKFAIDVSGSVSKKELMVTLSEINNIFNYYKLDGELIYWSTMVGDAGMFSSLKDMLKIEPVTTGGTDVRCVFDYLAGKTKVHGMAEKDRVRDMKAIFIITDGYFDMNFSDYAEMFGKRIVWLITGIRGNTVTFNPPFGRVLSLNLDND